MLSRKELIGVRALIENAIQGKHGIIYTLSKDRQKDFYREITQTLEKLHIHFKAKNYKIELENKGLIQIHKTCAD